MSTLRTSTQSGGRGGRPGAVRLTARGRVVLLVALLVAVMGLLVALGPAVVATSRAGAPLQVRVVVVQPGDTLWDIASHAAPDGDVGAALHAIAELNALPSTGELQVGQRIAVPRT